MNLQSALKLCLVTGSDYVFNGSYEELVKLAVKGGVTTVQFRHKSQITGRLELAHALCKLLKSLHIPFLINDDIELAMAVSADGVHLGQQDSPPEKARELLGPDAIIGWSVNNMSDLIRANQSSVINYIGVGAVYQSSSKTDCETVFGVEGLSAMTKLSLKPVVAIGGITVHNVQDVMACQVAGVAVIAAIHQSPEPESAAGNLMRKILHNEQH